MFSTTGVETAPDRPGTAYSATAPSAVGRNAARTPSARPAKCHFTWAKVA